MNLLRIFISLLITIIFAFSSYAQRKDIGENTTGGDDQEAAIKKDVRSPDTPFRSHSTNSRNTMCQSKITSFLPIWEIQDQLHTHFCFICKLTRTSASGQIYMNPISLKTIALSFTSVKVHFRTSGITWDLQRNKNLI
jgi:hypothetical protein